MSEETTEESSQAGSLFSKLPSTRPGVRSPRRPSSADAEPEAAATAPPKKPAAVRAARAATSASIPQPPPTEPAPPPEASDPFDPDPSADPFDTPATEPSAEQPTGVGPAGLEDLAWAGVAVTAEAATLGVRLLGRAFEAARRAAERG
jgi:hypothetical protein